MCGIAGYCGHDAADEQPAVLSMLAALSRRGPDGEGVHAWEETVLGHRRLAIFDLTDAGKQPMLAPDGRTGVSFNGAIFNFPQLREELRDLGYRFTSRTDTEVLVHGYDAWGIERLVRRLHGMFAFALWDDREKALYLVRDRLGVKPLYYRVRENTLAFASTASALDRAGFAGGIDSQAVAEFLEFGFVTDERSIFAGVQKLPAGHIARWRAGELTIHRYWQPNTASSSGPSFEEAVDETERLLLRAVELRLEADVPVGALLSGGIDSSLVCWAIRRLGGDITAYTIATPGDAWDESSDAISTANELGIAHRVLAMDPQSAPSMADLVSAYGEPFACASALGMLAISRAVREHAKVLLTGDGGDDAFLGYPRDLHYFTAQRLARLLPSGSDRAWRAVRGVLPKGGAIRRGVHFLDYATGGFPAVVAVKDGMPFYMQHGILGERLRAIQLPHRLLVPSRQAALRVLDDNLQFEQKTRFVAEYLPKVDGATMYYGVEARSPMLDQQLWEYASSLPYGVRLHGMTLKAILREIAHRRIGPRVARGAKRGFGVPVQRWLTGRWRADFEAAFTGSVLEREGWIDADAVLRAMQGFGEGETAPEPLWYLYVLEHWMRSVMRAPARSSAPTAA